MILDVGGGISGTGMFEASIAGWMESGSTCETQKVVKMRERER